MIQLAVLFFDGVGTAAGFAFDNGRVGGLGGFDLALKTANWFCELSRSVRAFFTFSLCAKYIIRT